MKLCDCIARRVRTLWIEDNKEVNSTVIEMAVSSAWMEVNSGVTIHIGSTVRQMEYGFQGDTDGYVIIPHLKDENSL